MKLEDHIQLSHSGVDHYQNESQHAEIITLDASLSAAWPCNVKAKIAQATPFTPCSVGMQRWPQDNSGSLSACR